MANLGTLIDGAYNGAYATVSIGPTQEGFRLEKRVSGRAVEESDVYGGTLIDYFYRGGSCLLSCDAQEYKAGTIAPIWPFGGMGEVFTSSTPCGRRASDIAAAIVLTSTAGTPAAAAPASLTATYAIQAMGNSLRLDFHTVLRTVPIVLQLLPYTSSGKTVWFTLT